MTTKNKVSKQQALHELWRRGILKFKCHSVQLEMYNLFYNAKDNTTLTWLLARQSGKSYLLAILALEQALKKPNSIIKLLTDTKVHVRSIFEKIFIELLEDCPNELKPNYAKADYEYTFYNGSKIQLAGSDNGHYERLRGQKSSLVLVDEAGFCNNLEDVVKSVLLPTTTHTGGKIVLASTPPPDPNHDFYRFIEEADLNGTLTKKTIYDNPLLKQEQIDRIVKEMGGAGSVKFRREYLCEHIRDEENVIFPEFDEVLEKQIVKEWPKPPFYHSYVSMDLGFHDLSVVIFAYHDFRADKIIIEDELVIKGRDFKLPDVVKMIKQKEQELWMNLLTNEQIKPKLRVSDINLIVTNEIARESGGEIIFQPTRKDEAEAAMNNLRVLISNGKIIINPKCETTLRHIKNAKWSVKQGKKQLARSPDMGHYDAIDAMKYLVRNISFNSNPYPAHYGMNLNDLHIQNPSSFYKNSNQSSANVWKNIFNIKGK